MEKVQIIPPPKDVDPRVLAWKGASVLAKMESVNDMWVTPQDWVSSFILPCRKTEGLLTDLSLFQDKLELRAIRERCFFF